jgi:CMP-N-acetylneuraminic acid synthetase
MMIRRSAFNEIRGFDETLTRQEGTDFYYRLTKHRQVDHIDLALWFYRHHDSQMSNAHNEVIQARHEVKEMHQKEGERILAIIPARGGSKGIPRKNLIKLDGLPLVTHAIRMAKSSKHDMMIALSTEDEEIAQVGLDEGIAVLHRDPKDAEDEVNLITVAKHAMESMDNTYRADIVVTIQPTSPGTPVAALDNALSRMLGAPLTMKPGGSGIFNVDAVVCMSEPRGKHPFRLYSRTGEADFTPFFPDKAERYLQRQDRELAYQFTGGFYCRRRHLLEAWDGEGFALGRWEGELVTKEQGIDIDDALDLHLARAFLEEKI